MEHSDELARTMLAGLPDQERRETIESIRHEVARELERLRGQVAHEAQEIAATRRFETH